MALQNGEQYTEILDCQAHIWNHIFSFIRSMALKCAIQLQIPDILDRHGAPMSLSELVEALPVNKERSQFVYRLMRVLVHSGFFLKQTGGADDKESERYSLAPPSRILLKEEPLSVRPFLLAMLDPVLMDPWQNMSKWFQNDDTQPFHTTHGREFWDYASHDPKLNQFFHEAMASDSRIVSTVLCENYGDSFEGLNSIVDVGGGTGTFAKAIVEAFPNIYCISFDIPHVVCGLEGSTNMIYVGGDMFDAIPKADAVFLKSILHDWNDEECIKIMKQCKEAISCGKNGGKVIIIDMVLIHGEGEEKLFETQILSDMLMMTLTNGRQRNEKDWANIFREAGFSNYKIKPAFGLRSLIEVYP